MTLEYLTFNVDITKDLAGELNSRGQDGWAVAEIVSIQGNFSLVVMCREPPRSPNPLLGA